MKIEVADGIPLFEDTDQRLRFLLAGGIFAELLLDIGFTWKIPGLISTALALYFQLGPVPHRASYMPDGEWDCGWH